MKHMRSQPQLTLLAGAVMAGSLLAGQAAMAQSSIFATTLSAWINTGGISSNPNTPTDERCTNDGVPIPGVLCDQDKRYTFSATSFLEDDWVDIPVVVATTLDALGPGIDLHELTLSGLAALTNETSQTLAYTIDILSPPALEGTVFATIQAGSTAQGEFDTGDTSVVKEVFGGGLGGSLVGTSSSLDGVEGAEIPCTQCTAIGIVDTYFSTGDAVLTAATNVFTQSRQVVPEPASIALFGLGLVGIGAAMRRRRED